MTEPDRKLEEEIRRALCAASDLIIPSGDGLNKIRERTARRPPALSWFLAYVAHLPRQLVRGGRVAASEVAATRHGYSSLGLVLAAARRWPGQARHVLRTPGIWVRPVLAGATALLLVVAVTLSVPRLRQQVTAQLDSAFGSSSGPSSSGGGTGGGGGGAQANGAAPIGSQTTTHMPGKPFLATMPAGSTQCQDQGSGATTTTRDSSGTVAARTNAGAANSVGVTPPGYVGPEPASLTCTPSTAPTEEATSSPVASVTTTPVTTPPVAASTPPTTTTPTSTPTTTPPTTTSPVTTPPTTTPPATTSPPATSTSSAGNTPAAPDTSAPGG
jgi:hypothetical protein